MHRVSNLDRFARGLVRARTMTEQRCESNSEGRGLVGGFYRVLQGAASHPVIDSRDGEVEMLERPSVCDDELLGTLDQPRRPRLAVLMPQIQVRGSEREVGSERTGERAPAHRDRYRLPR